ncbi:MAG TPA: hypothetical protein VGP46_09040 [Acidimicrobiales bacterium]|nr:hypothetical protein [Acidimicrobiales bacterium]
MIEDTSPETDWRLPAAKAAFNGTWDLIDKGPNRTEAEDREMLASTGAQWFLWQTIGNTEQLMIADWQVAHVLAWLGSGPLSLSFAAAALARCEGEGWSDWRLASAYEGMARAHAVAGDAGERDRFAEAARAVLATLDDPEDIEIVGSQLATIPGLS